MVSWSTKYILPRQQEETGAEQPWPSEVGVFLQLCFHSHDRTTSGPHSEFYGWLYWSTFPTTGMLKCRAVNVADLCTRVSMPGQAKDPTLGRCVTSGLALTKNSQRWNYWSYMAHDCSNTNAQKCSLNISNTKEEEDFVRARACHLSIGGHLAPTGATWCPYKLLIVVGKP
jgi:hypothetical protein